MKNLFVLSIVLASVTWAAQPNFIFMLSDDQDWTGLSVPMHPDVPGSKSSVIQTEHIARLAAQGMRFSAAYAPASVCSPTRISLQTGKSPAALHWTKAAPTVTAAHGYKLVAPVLQRAISAEEVTIAERLKELGYATAHYGKWHIQGGGPEQHGYDESDGNTGNKDAAPFKDPNPVDIFGMGERASVFMAMNAAAGKPFFIQLSYHALHYPENASAAAVAKYEKLLTGRDKRGAGRAAISDDLDRGVGVIMAQVEKLGIADNTYLIYMSDNGAGGKGGSRPLTGGKGSVWEGGIRVPLIIRGPGIDANSWCHQRVVGYDLFPTLYKLAGGRKPLPAGVEGGDFAHLLRGKDAPVQRPREELVFHFPHYQSSDGPHSSILLGDYKLIFFYETGEKKLFNLAADLGERVDLVKVQAAKAAELFARMKAYFKAVDAQLPRPNPDYDPDKPPVAQARGKRGKEGEGERKPKEKQRKKRSR